MKKNQVWIKILILCLLGAFSCRSDSPSTKDRKDQEISRLYEIAQPRVLPPMVPRYSDVVMRHLTFRPINEKDSISTVEQIKQFHATRIEWVYCYKFDDSERAKIEVKLLIPNRYDEEKNKEAEENAIDLLPSGEKRGPAQAEAYRDLVDSMKLVARSDGDWTGHSIPVLNPWGILIVESNIFP